MALGITAYSEAAFSSEANDVIAYPLGTVLTASMGEESNTGTANVDVTGIQATLSNGEAVAGSSVLVSITGSQLTTSIGEETAGIGVPVTGQQLSITNKTSTQDTLTAFGESPFATLSPSTFFIPSVIIEATTGAGQLPSFLLQSTLGTFSVSADGNVSVVVTEHTLNTSIGSEGVTADANVSVTGTQMATSLGGETIDINTPVDVSGIQMTGSLGDVIPTDFAVVSVTGIELQSSVGSPNITAWAEINPGVNNVWTEVDKAA